MVHIHSKISKNIYFLNQIYTFFSWQMLLKQEKVLHLLGTTFSCGLIHIWCASQQLWNPDCVEINSQKPTVFFFMVINSSAQCVSIVSEALLQRKVPCSFSLILVFSWDLLILRKYRISPALTFKCDNEKSIICMSIQRIIRSF